MDIFTTVQLPWAQLGWGVIVVGVVISIIRGYLVPRPFHQDLKADRDHWRNLAEELQKENTKLLITGELGVSSIMAIEAGLREKRDEQ
jgi:hypothetical protein